MTGLTTSTSRRGLLVGASALLVAGCSATDDPAPGGSSGSASTGAPASSPVVSASASGSPSSPSVGGTAEPSLPWPEGRRELTGFDTPWSICWLADGSALVSQRDDARVRRVSVAGDEFQVGEAGRVPGVLHGGEGGLLGLLAHPDREGHVFAYRTTVDGNRVDLFRVVDGGEWEPVAQVGPMIPHASNHNGGRLGLGPDGKLYVATGDAAVRARSQDPDDPAGKILRVELDGGVPSDNPTSSPVWSVGHRNVQGLAWDKDDRFWASEFGPSVDDELNLIEPGRNYGWPEVTGVDVTDGSVPAVHRWPSTADASPSAIAVSGRDCFVACLRGQKLYRLTLPEPGREFDARGDLPMRVVFDEGVRLRDVTLTPDGRHLWVATNEGAGSRVVQLPLDELRS